MTVQELIDKLNEIQDKQGKIYVRNVTGKFGPVDGVLVRHTSSGSFAWVDSSEDEEDI